GAASWGSLVGWCVPSGRTRARPGNAPRLARRSYGENGTFIAEWRRAAPTLIGSRPRVGRSLSQLIRHLGDARHGAFLVAFGARSAHPHGADRLVTDLDRNAAA